MATTLAKGAVRGKKHIRHPLFSTVVNNFLWKKNKKNDDGDDNNDDGVYRV